MTLKQSLILADLQEADAIEAARESLRAFTKEMWSVRESTPFEDNWVIGALCEHLEACHTRQIRRLLINIYPRSLKSNLASVYFPAWVWGLKPEERFLYVSYAQSLALRDANHTREVFDSARYKEIFPNAFNITKDTAGYYENDKTGSRISIGSGAQQTGVGSNIKLFDDPNDTNLVESPVIRDSMNNRFDNLSTRSDNFANDVYILIQQRTHPKDVTGHIDELGLDFVKLIIPLEYDGRKSVTCLGSFDPRKEIGDVADPLRFPPAAIKELKTILGYRYQGQVNQIPGVPEGDAVKRDWYQPYVSLFDPSEIVAVRLAYDVGFSDSPTGDWTWGSLKAKKKDGSVLTLWQHFGHWDNVRRRENIAEYGLRVALMMKEMFPNIKWKLTLEAGIGAGVEVVKEDIKYLQGQGLPAETVRPEARAKPVRAIAYLSSCQGGFTKFYDGVQLMAYGMIDGINNWIKPFLEIVTLLRYSDDGLEFLGGKDDPIDSEVMSHDGVAAPDKDWGSYLQFSAPVVSQQ